MHVHRCGSTADLPRFLRISSIDRYMDPDRKESLLLNFTQLAAQTDELSDEERTSPRGGKV